MRKLLFTTALVTVFAVPALAQTTTITTTEPRDPATQATGVLAGAGTGAAAGALIGGPAGAVIGGFVGTAIGATASAPPEVREYVVANPVAPVAIEGEITEGMVVPEGVELVPVSADEEFAYLYADGNRPVIVRASDRTVVYSPPIVSQQAVTYVEANPVDEVVLEGEVTIGESVPETVVLQPLPEAGGYSYFYANGRAYIVNDTDRQVIYYGQ